MTPDDKSAEPSGLAMPFLGNAGLFKACLKEEARGKRASLETAGNFFRSLAGSLRGAPCFDGGKQIDAPSVYASAYGIDIRQSVAATMALITTMAWLSMCSLTIASVGFVSPLIAFVPLQTMAGGAACALFASQVERVKSSAPAFATDSSVGDFISWGWCLGPLLWHCADRNGDEEIGFCRYAGACASGISLLTVVGVDIARRSNNVKAHR